VVARVEELYPFPATELEALMGWYPNLQTVTWLQEEPANMGAWNYVRARMRHVINGLRTARQVTLNYCGRPESASTAEGSHSQHEAEQTRLLREAVRGVVERHTNHR
jgi:2-oxoglutarate dehydrogenase E1 component